MGFSTCPHVRIAPEAEVHGVTLSAEQAQFAQERLSTVDGARVFWSSWEEFDAPDGYYDLILCFGAFEHFARRGVSRESRMAGYHHFFDKCADLLSGDGELALQTAVLGCDASAKLDRDTPVTNCLSAVFPGAVPPTSAEVTEAAERRFRIARRETTADDYVHTYRSWYHNLLESRSEIERTTGLETFRDLRDYFGATLVVFRSHAWSMDRIRLTPHPVTEQTNPCENRGV